MTANQIQRRLVPIAEAGDQLGGVSRSTVYELVGEGLLTKVSIGRRSFITADSLDRYVDSLATQRD